MSLVSIIIPAYNQGRYLNQSIQSALNQTYPTLEVIVVDDGSTDNTAEVVHRFTDLRLRYIYQENQGLSEARNTGLRAAHGSFITFLDSDDLFLPEKLALLVADLQSRPELGLTAGQSLLIDEQGNRTGKVYDKPPPEDGLKLLLGNPLHVGSVLLRRSWYVRVGGFDKNLQAYEDWDMWLRLARAGCRIGWVAQPVSLYRFHTSQMTRDGKRMTRATFAVLDKFFSDPALPKNWRALRDLAYSNAYLRAAAQAFRAGAFDDARLCLTEAAQLDPALSTDGAAQLARRIVGWATSPKTLDPLTYLENVYANLPETLSALRLRRTQELAQTAIQLAFESHQQHDRVKARRAMWRAFRYQPALLKNRGAVSIFIQSLLAPAQPR